MNVWERYDHYKDPDRIKARPWWRIVGTRCGPRSGSDALYLRDDGKASITKLQAFSRSREDIEYMMAELDRETPMAPPEPAVGQVWRIRMNVPFQTAEVPVTHVLQDDAGLMCKLGGGIDTWFASLGPEGNLEVQQELLLHAKFEASKFQHWPPERAICVGGPGSPWAPADYQGTPE